MTPPTPIDVLLLSARPEHHAQVLATLRARGLAARVASSSGRVLRLLALAPPLVLVDLARPVMLSRAAVQALNAARGPSLVVALHEGSLDTDQAPLAELSVDGYCHAQDWLPVARIAMAATPDSRFTHH